MSDSTSTIKPELGKAGSDIAKITIEENDFSRGFIQFDVIKNKDGAVEVFELPLVNKTVKVCFLIVFK